MPQEDNQEELESKVEMLEEGIAQLIITAHNQQRLIEDLQIQINTQQKVIDFVNDEIKPGGRFADW